MGKKLQVVYFFSGGGEYSSPLWLVLKYWLMPFLRINSLVLNSNLIPCAVNAIVDYPIIWNWLLTAVSTNTFGTGFSKANAKIHILQLKDLKEKHTRPKIWPWVAAVYCTAVHFWVNAFFGSGQIFPSLIQLRWIFAKAKKQFL